MINPIISSTNISLSSSFLQSFLSKSKNKSIPISIKSSSSKGSDDKRLLFPATLTGRLSFGTDVISVLGMAISNNEIYNQKYTANPDGRYDSNVENTVNIKIKLKTDVNSKVRVYEYKREFIDGKWVGNWIEDESKASIQPLFIKGREYSLEVINNDKTDYDKIWNIAIKGNTAQEKINGKKKTEIDTMGFNDFKSRIFECTDVQYNDTGKIYVMAFEEKGN